MKTTGEHVRLQLRFISFLLFLAIFTTSAALAQDVTITNLTELVEEAFSPHHSLYLPWTPWQWRAYPTDNGEPWWVDCSQVACADLLSTSTNSRATFQMHGVTVTSVVLTKNILTGETLLQSGCSTDVIASIAAPSGYEPGAQLGYNAWVYRQWQQVTNCLDCWGLTADEIPPPIVTLKTRLADVSTYSIYQSDVEAAAEAAAAAWASSASSSTTSGRFTAMDGGMMMGMDDEEWCTVSTDKFAVISISQDTNGWTTVVVGPTCTNYLVGWCSTDALFTNTIWVSRAGGWAGDGTTSWTDASTTNVGQRFYRAILVLPTAISDSDGDGIPDMWEVSHGSNPFNASDAGQTNANPSAHGLTNLQVYQNPSVLNGDNYSTVGDGVPDWWKVKYSFSIIDASVAGADPDHDGLSNLQEHQAGTDPLNYSTSADGLPDGWKVYYGLDPKDNGSVDPNNGASGDPDHDGITNLQEFFGGTDPTKPGGAEYKVIDLGTVPSGAQLYYTGSLVYAMNASNWVVGAYVTNGHYQAFLARPDAGITLLGTLGGPESLAYGINDYGQIVGISQTLNGYTHACEWVGGTMTDLGYFPDGWPLSYAYGINNAGAVTGVAYLTNNTYHAFLYQSGVMQDLGTLPGGDFATGYAINDIGQIAGISWENVWHASIFSGGAVQDLGILPGWYLSMAFAINNQGDVVGVVQSSSGTVNPHPFLYHGGNMVDMNTLLATNSTTGLNKAFSINDRGQILCLGSNLQTGKGDVYLYDNGSAVRVKDLFDDASWTNLQYGMGFKVINDAGQIGWIATSSNGTSHVVVLTPAVEFVREKTPGCGWFVNVDKAGLPVFQPDSGIGRGPAPMPTGITAIDLMLQENLSNDAVGGMYVSCENSVGSFSGLLRETAPASGVFTNGDGSFTVTLNPVVQTSGNQVDVLDITVSSQGQALTNLALIAQETDTNSLEFANVIPHAELDMTGPFASNTVSTIQLQLDTNWDPTDFDGALTETAPNSLVFTSATGNVTLTVNNFTGLSLTQQDVMAVTISNTMMTAKHFTLTLTETTPNSQHFSNFGIRQVTDITPVTPDVSGEGVFYVRTHGSSTGTNAINIKLKTDTEEITVPAIRLSNTTTYMTGKLLVVPAGASVSYSGITVIHDDPTSIVASRVDIPLSQTTNTLVRQAFVGRGDDIWYGLHISNGGHFDIIEQLLRANLHYTVRRNLTVTLATVVSELPSNSVWYCFAHGATLHGSADEPFLGFNVWQSESWRSWSAAGITPAIVANAIGTNSYTMVFINGCLSADPSEGSNAGAMASAFRAKAYVGWTKEVRDGVALRAAETFFNALVTTNVEGAISIAQPYPGDDTMPQLRVIGDGSVRIDLTNPR